MKLHYRRNNKSDKTKIYDIFSLFPRIQLQIHLTTMANNLIPNNIFTSILVIQLTLLSDVLNKKTEELLLTVSSLYLI